MKIEGSLLGHKFRCFDARFSRTVNGESMLLTASEDGTAKLWKVNDRKCIFTFKHNKDCEVLRAAFLNSSGTEIVTCGADGKCIVWELESVPASSAPAQDSGAELKRKYKPICVLDHGDAQIYVCESVPFLDGTTSAMSNEGADLPTRPRPRLLTAADDKLYIWDLSNTAAPSPRVWTFVSVINGGLESSTTVEGGNEQQQQQQQRHGQDASSTDASIGASSSANANANAAAANTATSFGGPRNTEHTAFVFDAKCCPANPHKVAVALSDGTVRIVDTNPRGPVLTEAPCEHTAAAAVAAAQSQGQGQGRCVGLHVGGLLRELQLRSVRQQQQQQQQRSRDGSSGSGSSETAAKKNVNNANDQDQSQGEGLEKGKNGSDGVHAEEREQEKEKEEEEEEVDTTPPPHATGVAWAPDSSFLLVSLGDGSVLLLDTDASQSQFTVRCIFLGHTRCCFGVACLPPSVTASVSALPEQAMEGGVPPADALPPVPVGSKRIATAAADDDDDAGNDDYAAPKWRGLSWSSDGSLCQWDLSESVVGVVREPLQRIRFDAYSIYACAVMNGQGLGQGQGQGDDGVAMCACAGSTGGGPAGFLGVPVHLVRLE